MIRAIALSVALSFALSLASSVAAVPTQLTVGGIPSFDTNLGTLLSVTVTLDPPPQATNEYEAAVFENFGLHDHIVNPFPITVAGLDTYDFPPTTTSTVNPSTGQDHNHFFNLPPIVETYTGGDLAWFLNPANGVGLLNIVAPPTTEDDDHTHTVSLQPVLPTTRFLYEPAAIPEPAAGLLMTLAAGHVLGRRRKRVR